MNQQRWNDDGTRDERDTRYMGERFDEDRGRGRGSWGANGGQERQSWSNRPVHGARDIDDPMSREPYGEAGFERGSYAARYGFQGNPNVRSPESSRPGSREWDGGWGEGRRDERSWGQRRGEGRGGDGEGYGGRYPQTGYGDDSMRGGRYERGGRDMNPGSSYAGYGSDSSFGRGGGYDGRSEGSSSRGGSSYGSSMGANSWMGYGANLGGSHMGSSSSFGEPSARSYGETSRYGSSSQMRGQHSGKGPKGYRRSDDRLKEDISERLKNHPEIDASEIEIEVQGGKVTLKGEVTDRYQKRCAEDCIEDVAGVDDVSNQLQVQARQDSDESRENTTTLPYNRNKPNDTNKGKTGGQDNNKSGQANSNRSVGSSSGT